MVFDLDPDLPRKPSSQHVIGQDLSVLSVAELDERIAQLRSEIDRLSADRARKAASKEAAASIFKL